MVWLDPKKLWPCQIVRERLDSPVFTLIFIWHGAALASPAVITVTLGVQAGSVDTTVPSAVEAIICNYNTF